MLLCRWGPSAAGVGGLGGSEEAVLYLSEQVLWLFGMSPNII